MVDLAIGHVKAIEKMAQISDGVLIYNLGTGIGYSVLDIVKGFEKAVGKPIPYTIKPRRPGDIATCYACLLYTSVTSVLPTTVTQMPDVLTKAVALSLIHI